MTNSTVSPAYAVPDYCGNPGQAQQSAWREAFNAYTENGANASRGESLDLLQELAFGLSGPRGRARAFLERHLGRSSLERDVPRRDASNECRKEYEALVSRLVYAAEALSPEGQADPKKPIAQQMTQALVRDFVMDTTPGEKRAHLLSEEERDERLRGPDGKLLCRIIYALNHHQLEKTAITALRGNGGRRRNGGQVDSAELQQFAFDLFLKSLEKYSPEYGASFSTFMAGGVTRFLGDHIGRSRAHNHGRKECRDIRVFTPGNEEDWITQTREDYRTPAPEAQAIAKEEKARALHLARRLTADSGLTDIERDVTEQHHALETGDPATEATLEEIAQGQGHVKQAAGFALRRAKLKIIKHVAAHPEYQKLR